MKKHLFIFTIGPVQSFIAQARKVIDYENGSRLLSDLIDEAIKEFNKITKNENQNYSNTNIIYPSEEIESKPNRFIAKVELTNDNKEKIIELGSQLVDFVKKLLKKKFNDIFNKIITSSREGEINPERIGKCYNQIDSFLEYYWVSLSFEGEGQYFTQYTELENWLGAVKNKRIIKQIQTEGERGVKCDLCGERKALLFFKERKSFSSTYATTIGTLNKQLMNEKEGLCAICLIKRFYNTRENSKKSLPLMNSTAGISLGHLLLNDNFKREFGKYSEIFGNLFDEDYYFEEELLQISEEDKKLQKFKSEAKKWFESNKKLFKNTIWSKYYAFILFDGDDIGKWVSGTFLPDKSKLQEFHSNMSKNLGDYTNQVKQIFAKYNGLLVYAGGDDICGFINIIHLWALLKEMRLRFPDFREIITGNTTTKIYNKINPSTASCGICIAHYGEPLRRVIKTARSMEHRAKRVDKKDAISLAILKPSGNVISAISKWELSIFNTNPYFITDLADRIINDLKKEIFSNKFIKNLELEFWWNKYDSNANHSTDIKQSKELVKVEFERLLYRSVLMNKAINNIKKEDLMNEDHPINREILNPLKQFLENTDFSNFCSFLHICEFLKSKQLNYNQIIREGRLKSI